MPFYIIVLIAVALLGTTSLNWKQRRLAAQKAALTAEQPIATTPPPAPTAPLGRVTQGFSTLRDRFSLSANLGAKRPNLSHRFREWTTSALAQDESVNLWLAALSPDAHTAFTQQVAEFCSEMGFELAALIDGQLAEIPATAQQATTIVLQYCRANQQAAMAQDDFDAANRFLAYLRAPAHKSNAAFGQKLYGKLIEAQLVPPPSFDMMLAAEEIRRANGLAAIHQAAAQNPIAFNAVLKSVTLESTNLPLQEALASAPVASDVIDETSAATTSTTPPEPSVG